MAEDRGGMVDDLNAVAEFLALRSVPALTAFDLSGPVDAIVLCGSTLLDPAHTAVAAFRDGLGRRILITGGIGHATAGLRENVSRHARFRDVAVDDRPEAQILEDILVRHFGVDPSRVVREDRSTNCGANALECKRTMDAIGGVSSLLLIQDPTMQRRSQASFERAFGPTVRIVSFAPFIPKVAASGEGFIVSGGIEPIWSFNKFVAMALGDIDRLRDDEKGYGPRGHNYIDHIEIPPEISLAYDRIKSQTSSPAWASRSL